VKPPAKTARRIALGLSITAVLVSLGCGFFARQAFALRAEDPERLMGPVLWFLVLLLVALLLRMGAAACELIWLYRTWSNLPEPLRKIGPIEKVEPGLLVGMTLVPGIAWIWKLGVIDSVTKGFEAIRMRVPYDAPVPRSLGIAAVIVGWVPGLNVYLAPFLWELFAIRIDRCVDLILQRSHAVANGS
jgi:hypothetical protein